MSKQMVINVDLADVFAQPGRKEFLHPQAWGESGRGDGDAHQAVPRYHARETPQPLGTACNWPKLE